MSESKHVERVWSNRARRKVIAPYDTFKINPAIERSWRPSNSGDFEVVNFFYLFFRWLLVKTGFLVQFTYTVDEEYLTVGQRLADQINMVHTKYRSAPAVIFIGSRQERELQHEFRDVMVPYGGGEAVRHSFGVDKWQRSFQVMSSQARTVGQQRLIIKEIGRLFGSWATMFAAETFDYGSTYAFQGGKFLGVDYVTLPWMDGIVVVPQINGFDGIDRDSLIEKIARGSYD